MAPKTPNTQADKKVMDALNEVFLYEMAGVVRYMHYSFMIMGHNRIPIQKWFRDQATESMAHAVTIGEKITSLGGHPSMAIPPIKETKDHTIQGILSESLDFELEALDGYKKLVAVAGDDIALDELAREFVRTETEHVEEVEKMLKKNA